MPERAINTLTVLYDYIVKQRGLDADLALDNGWYASRRAGDDNARIVIPCTNSRGRVYFQARAVDTAVEKRYQSPPYAQEDSVVVVWPKEASRSAVIVEGPFDALAAAECGHIGIATMGNRPSRATLQNICTVCPVQSLLVVPDLDSISAGVLTVGRLALLGRTVRLALPVGAKDLSRMPKLARSMLLGC
jgi:DNA primase